MFQQFFDPTSHTYTYLVADVARGEAVLIDPVVERKEDYLQVLRDKGLRLAWILETHVHADHVTGANALKAITQGQSAVGRACHATGYDRALDDGDTITFGDETIRVIATPGHTPGSVTFHWRDRIFSGDALLIGGCGRTDFQLGNAGTLYESITQRLFRLDPDTLVYPGHDYKGRRVSSIAEEKSLNPRLAGKTREEFVALMDGLELPPPARIHEALPANLAGGSL